MKPDHRYFLMTMCTLLPICQCSAEIIVVPASGFELQLTPGEQAALIDAPRTLVSEPSRHLESAISTGLFKALVLDQRGDATVADPIVAVIRYPAESIDESLSMKPGVECKGTLYPIVWTSCVETTEAYLTLQAHGYVRIQPESITPAEAASVLAKLKQMIQPSNLRVDQSMHVYKIRYVEDSDCYSVRGDANGVPFSAVVPPDRHTTCSSSELRELTSP